MNSSLPIPAYETDLLPESNLIFPLQGLGNVSVSSSIGLKFSSYFGRSYSTYSFDYLLGSLLGV